MLRDENAERRVGAAKAAECHMVRLMRVTCMTLCVGRSKPHCTVMIPCVPSQWVDKIAVLGHARLPVC